MQFRTNLVQEAFGARSHYGKEVVPYACNSANRGSAVAGYEVRPFRGRGGASSEGLGLEGPFPAEGGFLLRPQQI